MRYCFLLETALTLLRSFNFPGPVQPYRKYSPSIKMSCILSLNVKEVNSLLFHQICHQLCPTSTAGHLFLPLSDNYNRKRNFDRHWTLDSQAINEIVGISNSSRKWYILYILQFALKHQWNQHTVQEEGKWLLWKQFNEPRLKSFPSLATAGSCKIIKTILIDDLSKLQATSSTF